MQIRPLVSSDIGGLRGIDGVVECMRYLHVEPRRPSSSADPSADPSHQQALLVGWNIEARALRERRVDPNTLSEDSLFVARQIAAGHEEGVGLVTEYDGQVLALALAVPDPALGVLRLVDLRVDFDYRRQGMGTALGYMLMQHARDRELRAVAAETQTDNVVMAEFLRRLGFELSGIDTRRRTNHDLVKERATLFWYAPLD